MHHERGLLGHVLESLDLHPIHDADARMISIRSSDSALRIYVFAEPHPEGTVTEFLPVVVRIDEPAGDDSFRWESPARCEDPDHALLIALRHVVEDALEGKGLSVLGKFVVTLCGRCDSLKAANESLVRPVRKV